jgi:hypothetical protein
VLAPACRTSTIPCTIKPSQSRVASASGWEKKTNFTTVYAGQAVGIEEVHDDIWLVSFMDYDLGYFDLETRVLEPLENPFGPKVLPMS